MKIYYLKTLFKVITFISLLLVLYVMLSKPTVIHTHTNISGQDISTTIIMTSNQLFIFNRDNFERQLYTQYINNTLPDIILSEIHYDETHNTSVELIVYINKLAQFFDLEPSHYIF